MYVRINKNSQYDIHIHEYHIQYLRNEDDQQQIGIYVQGEQDLDILRNFHQDNLNIHTLELFNEENVVIKTLTLVNSKISDIYERYTSLSDLPDCGVIVIADAIND